MKVCLSLLIGILVSASAAPATTYLVRPDGSGDFPTIQAAVNVAVDSDVIELGAGTFTGSGNRGVYIRHKAITVRSQSGDPSACTIDCAGLARGFDLSLTHSGTAVEGITITRGSAVYGGGLLGPEGTWAR
jgi:hypothetical protein